MKGFEGLGFSPVVQPLKEFEDDYGLKFGDEDEEDDDDEDDDDEDDDDDDEDDDDEMDEEE